MNKLTKALAVALPLLAAAVTAQAVQADDPAVYEGRVNHIDNDAVVRISYRGGQIRVKARNLAADEIAPDELKGRTVRVLEPEWRNGYLEGRVEFGSAGQS